MSKGVTRILISHYMPSLNKGEMELLEGILKSLAPLGSVEVSAFSIYPELDKERFPSSVKLIDICKDLHIGRYLRGGTVNAELLASFFSCIQHLFFVFLLKILGKNALRIMKGTLWREYCASDVFILCTSEDDIVNGNFLWFSPIYISLVAKTLHKMAVVYANSNTETSNIVWIWRLKSRMLWRILARYFLNKMDLVTTRDKKTFELYKSLAKDDIPIYFTGDVGVLLEPINLSATKRIMIREKVDRGDGLLMGASISRRLLLHAFQEYSEPEEKYEKGITKIAEVFDKLVTEYRLKIVFLPHCIEFYRNNDDRLVGYNILRKMKNKDRFKVVSNEYSPQELKGLIGQFDIFVGDRIHALISALSMGVPCCAMAYRSDRRPYSLIGEGFDQKKWIFEVETFETDTLIRLLTELITASAEIKENLPPIIQRAKKRALRNGQLLKKLLVAKRKYQRTNICAFDCADI